jgi:long-subunit fatty acid transport protein
VRPLVVLILLCGHAAADPLDELGFGAAATGMGNARTALAVGAEAIHLDPAGVALAQRPELLVGWQYAHDRLSLDGNDADLLDAHGTSLGIAIPFRIGKKLRFGTGVALYLPDQFLARIQLTPISEPHYVRFESAAHRIVVEPVFAVAVGDWAFGAGASVLADAKSRDLTFGVGVVGGDKQADARLDIALPVRYAPLVSARWKPSRMVELAASFRGELSLDLDLDIVANIDVPNVVTGDVKVALRSVSYFTPMRATIGAAVHPRDDLVITADLTWERWSSLGSGAPDLSVLIALDITPPLVSSMQPPANFHDIVTPRAGAEWRTGKLRLRAGAGYLPSPVPAQTGITSFADGARVLATGGAGIRIEPGAVLAQPIDLDLGIAWQHVAHDLVHKDPMLQPGGAFSSGGDILQASASATVRF